jgi:hypothetical protein
LISACLEVRIRAVPAGQPTQRFTPVIDANASLRTRLKYYMLQPKQKRVRSL